jgi:hypothetical protein
MTRMALPAPALHTARLWLRPFDDADANDLFALHSSAYVLRYWDAPPWSERVRAERFITACRQMAQEGTGTRLAVDRVCDGTFIGCVRGQKRNRDLSRAFQAQDASSTSRRRYADPGVLRGQPSPERSAAPRHPGSPRRTNQHHARRSRSHRRVRCRAPMRNP